MKKVIITGGNGFIGKHLVKQILSCGGTSLVLVSNTAYKHRYLQDRKVSNGAALTLYSADIRNQKDILNIFLKEKADTCIHLAAKISVSDSIRDPDETMKINAIGTLNVLEGCRKSGVNNFVLASSAAVYGDTTSLPITEKSTLNPLSPYGASKMLAEEHVFSYSKLKKIQNAIILRIFNVYGTGQSSESDVITRFTSRLSKGLPPKIYGDGLHTRDFISVDDVVESMLLSVRLMEERQKVNKSEADSAMVFNIGTGIPTSIKDLAEKMIQIFGHNLQPIYEKIVDKEVILHSYADITKSKEILHFVPKKTIETGLREIIDSMFRK